jgi:hypothetical protein
MPIELSPEFVRNAIYNRHPNSTVCEEFAKKLDVHAKGDVPKKLIFERRPSESEQTKEYRKKIYVPVTKEAISKVINSLSKIRRSQDWSIQYNPNIPSSVKGDESLEEYCEKNYPVFNSLTNWAFSELLKRSLIDANSVCAVILKSLPSDSSEYFKPEVEIFDSSQIMNHSDEYYALQSADVVVEKGANNQNYERKVYYIVTTTQIARYEERSGRGLEQVLLYNHNIGSLPVTKVGGVYYDRKNNDTIQESRIASMVPFLDEAAREYSDLQAEIVNHVHSEKYIYTNSECPVCKGVGMSMQRDEKGNVKKCSNCDGKGRIASVSPYGVYEINLLRAGEQNMPNPAIGYVQKNTDIPRLQSERIDGHIYKALSSVNMEFLAQTPLNQSGIAKEVDQDELNNFVNSVAEDIVRVLDSVYYYICQYRYALIVPDVSKRNEMLPTIPVPERFGLLNSSILMQEIQIAKSANTNPVLIKNLEIDYARKKFNSDPEVAYELENIFELDPFYGYSQQDKMTMLSNGGITDQDFIISCNIAQFVQRANQENANFNRLTFDRKKQIIVGYAEEIVKLNSEKESMLMEIENQMANPDDEQGSGKNIEDN